MGQNPAAERLRTALDMYEFGENMLRARLRREDPTISDLAIDLAIDAWLADRPDAPLGDAQGRPTHRFE